MSSPSPNITEFYWGKIIVEGSRKDYKDAKIWPGGSREWDWKETGTRHSPGIQPADVDEIITKGVDYLILSRGMENVLQVPQSTIDYAKNKGVSNVIVENTKCAFMKYQDLVKTGARVGGLFHSTC